MKIEKIDEPCFCEKVMSDPDLMAMFFLMLVMLVAELLILFFGG